MIQGFFFPDDDEPEPCVRVAIELSSLRLHSESVDFVIDTGSTSTILHPYDVMRRLGMTEGELERLVHNLGREPIQGVGGSAEVSVVRARYTFTHLDDQQQSIETNVRLAEPTPTNMYMPSILGWDILRHFVIHLDWKQQSITLL